MFNATRFLVVTGLLLIKINAYAQDYTATVYEINKTTAPPLFTIDVKKTKTDKTQKIVATTANGSDVALEEIAVVSLPDYQVQEYNVHSYQTGEQGKLNFGENKISIEYSIKDKPVEKKEIDKPKNLVAPANFEQYLQSHFDILKKEKSQSVDFLIWDRHETIKFKVSYLGEEKLNGEMTQHFKMNIDNFLLAAFIDPIQIWYKQDMTQIRRFLGRVAMKKKIAEGKYENLDADVLYKYN